MNRAALEAAFRLANALPSTVNYMPTPEELAWKPRRIGKGFFVQTTQAVIDRMRELDATGLPRYQIARRMRVSHVTMVKYLGPRRRARKAR